MPNKYVYHVYVLKNLINNKLYKGSTNDINKRFIEHEIKKSNFTSRYEDWVLVFYITFIGKNSKEKAIKFEKYLKSGSGRAFTKKHFIN